MSVRNAVLRRFSRLRGEATTRRPDFKGERRQVSFRIAEDIAFGLEVVRQATGERKTAFLERILKKAVEDKIKELKQQNEPSAWETILRCARAAWR